MCLRIDKIYWGTSEEVIDECLRFKQKTLAEFIVYRDSYMNQIPDGEIDSGDKQYRFYKGSSIFFVSFNMTICLLVKAQILAKDETVKEFDEYVHNRDLCDGLTAEDVFKANYMLDYVIDKLT